MLTLTLASGQLRRLRDLLSRCDELQSNAELRALFNDARLAIWRSGVKEADNVKNRVDFLIDYLRNKGTTAGDHGLVLLLWALADQYEPTDPQHLPTDTRYDELLTIASELQYGLRVILPANSRTRPQLEHNIRTANSMLDVRAWLVGLAAAERAICRISVDAGDATAFGTGFLVASDIVLTNYHVIEPVLTGKALAAGVKLLFDYHLLEDRVTPHIGPSYRLAASDWLIDSSPYSALDLQAATTSAPAPDELDYALLRLAEPAGKADVDQGLLHNQARGPRGYLRLQASDYAFAAGAPLLIVQHPEGKELKLAFETDAILELNANQTRVRYRTNTEAGSSGSPCFDANWKLVALHHSGDPNYPQLKRAEYNQGIPITAIVNLLRKRDKLALLDV